MALYSDLISLLRQDVGDYPIRRFDSADGDGVSTLFQVNDTKVYENSLIVQVGGVLQAAANYTLDSNLGQIVFGATHIPASGNDNVTFQYQSVNLLDSDWVDLINQVLDNLRHDLWIEKVDQTTLQTTYTGVDYDLSSVAANILHLLNIEYTTDNSASNPAPWQSVRGKTNVLFYRDAQILHMRPAFGITGYQMRLRFNRAYVKGSLASDTLEVQSQYWHMIRKYCEALYWERMAAKIGMTTSALSKEKTFESFGDMKKIASNLRKEADQMFRRVRPKKPAVSIPTALYGVSI